MLSVAKRVMHAIDLMGRNEFELALEQVAICIDISSQHYYKKTSSSKFDFKKFLEEYYWVMELMAFNGIDLKNSYFSNFTVKNIEKPTLADIIYHIVRCSLVHSTGLPDNLTFNKEREIFCGPDYISLPTEIIWGLLASVVFTFVNASEQSQGDYFFKYEDFHFLICDSWGKEASLRSVYDHHVNMRVALNIPILPVPS